MHYDDCIIEYALIAELKQQSKRLNLISLNSIATDSGGHTPVKHKVLKKQKRANSE